MQATLFRIPLSIKLSCIWVTLNYWYNENYQWPSRVISTFGIGFVSRESVRLAAGKGNVEEGRFSRMWTWQSAAAVPPNVRFCYREGISEQHPGTDRLLVLSASGLPRSSQPTDCLTIYTSAEVGYDPMRLHVWHPVPALTGGAQISLPLPWLTNANCC